MSKYKVVRAFHTPTQSFPVGREFDDAELDGPIGIDHWRQQEFVAAIGGTLGPAPAPVVAPIIPSAPPQEPPKPAS